MLKNIHPDKFHEELHVNPSTFDAIITAIELDPMFQNRLKS